MSDKLDRKSHCISFVLRLSLGNLTTENTDEEKEEEEEEEEGLDLLPKRVPLRRGRTSK